MPWCIALPLIIVPILISNHAHLYVGVMVVGLWWGGKWQQDANLGPMYTPLTNLFEPNQKFQVAILSINITAQTWFGSWAFICAAGGGIHMGVWHRG